METDETSSQAISGPFSPRREAIAAACDRVAWWTLLLLVAAVPLLSTNMSFGSGQFRALTLDAVVLPKLVAIMVLSGVGLAAFGILMLLGRAKARVSYSMIPASLLVIWAGVSTAMSHGWATALAGSTQRKEGLIAYVAYLLVFILVVQVVNSTQRLTQLTQVMAGAGTVMALYALVQYLGWDPLTWQSLEFGNRLIATMGNPDMLAAYLVFTFALTVGLMLAAADRRRELWIMAAAATVQLAALALTLVRGAWIGIAVVAVVFVIAHQTSKRPITAHLGRVIAIGALLIAGIVALSVAVPQEGLTVVERLSSMFHAPSGSIAERLAIWRVAGQASLAHVFVGYGPGRFVEGFSAAAGAAWWTAGGAQGLPSDAHNIGLQSLVTLGIVGVILYTATIWMPLLRATSSTFGSNHRSALPVMCGIWAGVIGLLATLFSSVATPPVILWLWVGAAMLAATRATTVKVKDGIGYRAGLGVAVSFAVVFALFGASWGVADHLATLARDEADPIVAEQYAQRAIAVNPLPEEYWFLQASASEDALAQALAAGAMDDSARELGRSMQDRYTAAAEHDTFDMNARVRLLAVENRMAEVFGGSEAKAQALGDAKTAAARWPKGPMVVNQLARAQLNAGHPDDARASARKAVGLSPKFADAWQTLGLALRAKGDTKSAAEAFTRAAELDPSGTEGATQLQDLTGSGG
jgi:tetratricopeptide (TPR) repeat protein